MALGVRLGCVVMSGRRWQAARRWLPWLVAVVVVVAGVVWAGGAAAGSPRFVRIVSGVANPTYVTAAPGDRSRLYVVEQAGVVQIVSQGRVAGTFLDVRSLVKSGGEQGLLSMAFSPAYRRDHRFYVSYTDLGGNSRVVGYRSARGVAVGSSAHVILTLRQPYPNHNGGQLQFDRRGYLYVGFGDGGSQDDPAQTSENLGTRLGKLLRSQTTNPNGAWKVVALGLRNPWRFSFDRANGDLWIGEVGQDQWEEVDYRPLAKLDRLANYGWSRYEGDVVFDAAHHYTSAGDKVFPELVYSHGQGCSVTGGYVYRGPSSPAARGRYFYGDYCSGSIWSFPVHNGRAGPPRIEARIPALSSFGEDNAGNLYAVSQANHGAVYELR
jgi:glucose/arabinose dehydrogenase